MSLVPCSRCHKQIHAEASACRHCGHQKGAATQRYAAKRGFALHFMGATVLAVIGVGLWLAGQRYALNPEWATPLGIVLGATGTIWYVGARIWSGFTKL